MNKYNILHILAGILMFALVMFSHCYYTITVSFFLMVIFYIFQDGNPNTLLMNKELCVDKSFVVADLLGILIPRYSPTPRNRTIVTYTVIIVLAGFLYLKWRSLKGDRVDRIANAGAYSSEWAAEGNIGEGFVNLSGSRCTGPDTLGSGVDSVSIGERCQKHSNKVICEDEARKKMRRCYNNGYKCEDGYIPKGDCRRKGRGVKKKDNFMLMPKIGFIGRNRRGGRK